MDEEKEIGYHFYLTLKNDGSRRAIVSGNFIKNDEGYSISSENTGVYQEIDGEEARLPVAELQLE